MKKRIVAWAMILVIGLTGSQLVYAAEPEAIDVEAESGLQEGNSEEKETDEQDKQKAEEIEKEKITEDEAEENRGDEADTVDKDETDASAEQGNEDKEQPDTNKNTNEEEVQYNEATKAIQDNVSGYYYGKITNADGLSGLGIDGNSYEVSDDFNFNKAVQIWVGENQYAVTKFEQGVVVDIYAVSDICTPEVTLKTNPREVVYQNGSFNVNQFNLVVSVSNVLNSEYAFLPDSIKNRIQSKLTKLLIKPTTEGLNFGTNGFWFFQNNVTEITESFNQQIYGGEKREYSYTVNIDKNYKLTSASSVLGLAVTAVVDNKSYESQSKIAVGNLDYQIKSASEQKAKTNSGKAAVKANGVINQQAKNNVALDAKFTEYFDDAQLLSMQEFLYTYVGTVMAATSSSYAEKSDVKNKVYDKLGIDSSMLTIVTGTIADVDVKAKTKIGERRFHFSLTLGNYQLGQGTTYAGMAKIEYAVFENKASEPECNGTGVITYTDIKSFVSSLKDIAESAISDAYNSIWGNSASKIANYLTEGTILEALRKSGVIGEFSNNLFKLLEYPTERYMKVNVECPVDVRVYDLNGKLCGAIVNDVIDTRYHDIYMTVEDDKKSIYLANNNYYIEVTGNDEGTMDYSVNEYNADGTEVRTIDYNDLPVSKGATYTAAVPDASSKSSDLYNPINSEGNEVAATSDTTVVEESQDFVSWGVIDDVLYVYGKGVLTLHKDWEHNNTIKKVIFINGEIKIGKDTFEYCENLEKIEMNDYVTEIGYGSIYSCKSLRQLVIPKSVNSIGEWSFYGCDKLDKVVVDKDNQTYCEKDGLLYDKKQTELIYVPYGKSGTVRIPDSVININEGAFRNSTGNKIKKIILGNGIHTINGHEFYRCTELESLEFGSGIVEIGEEIFRSNVKTISFNGELPNSIDESAFKGIVATAYYPIAWTEIPEAKKYSGYLIWKPQGASEETDRFIVASGNCGHGYYNENVKWSLDTKGVMTISGTGAMEDYSYRWSTPWNAYRFSIDSVVIDEGITHIGQYTFFDCVSLVDVYIPLTVKSIGDSFDGFGAFGWTPWVKQQGEYIIANSIFLKYIGDSPEVIIPDNVTSIGDKAFYERKQLVDVKISENITNVGENAFAHCTGLTNVNIPKNVKDIGFLAFYDCSGLTSVNFSEGLESIDNLAFSSCTNLTKVIIPSTVERIGFRAFDGCTKLESVTLPNNLLKMEGRAFSDCNSLKEIKLKGNAPKDVEEDALEGCPIDMVIRVPKGTIGYDVAPWTHYKIVYEGDNPDTTINIPESEVNTIVNKIESADAGSYIKVEMKNATVLPKEILQAMQNKDIDISFTMNNNTVWEINGKDVKKDNLQHANLLVNISEKEEGTIPAQAYSPIVGELPANQLSFVNEGSFGFDARLTLTVDDSYNTKKGVFLGYAGETASLVNSSIVKEGKVTVKIDKAQNCMLVYVLNGDVDQDNNVTIRDMMRILHHVSDYQPMNILQQGAADTDFNNIVNIQDLMRMLHYVSGKSSSL